MDSSAIIAIVVAAGKGRRMGSPIPKQLMGYEGRTVLEHTASVFAKHEKVDAVVIVSPADGSLDEIYEGIANNICETCDVGEVRIVRGGAERQDSVQSGIDCAKLIAKEKSCSVDDAIVLIHDAARPGVTDEIIDRNIEALDSCRAAVTCVPAIDSIRKINEDSLLNTDKLYPIMISNVLERRLIYNVQTPQSFRLSDISSAYEKAKADGYLGTDDASVAEHAGIRVAIVEGSPSNFKITTAKDVPMKTRTGTGFDVHKLVSERALILCGTPVPYEKGLLGHSDADVATHALMDALLGAAGLGDIGKHFPDTDEKYKDADSLKLLAEVKEMLGDVVINNVDITIIAERPKLAPYINNMKENIASTLSIDLSAVNVKATTTEGLGFTGRGDGIAAMASCAIEGRF